MGLFSNFFDRFKAADFDISYNMKLKTVQDDFKKNFGLNLRVYKGKMLADPELTFAQLNHRTSKKINANSEELNIKANMKIGDLEELISEHFGLTVQVANEFNTYCIPNKYTLGQAARKEDFKDWCKERGYDSIEDWVKAQGCSSLEEYYQRAAEKKESER